MDPISALGLSAAIFQFVDFGSKIIATTYGAHHNIDGTTQENLDLAELTATLQDFQTRLATPRTLSRRHGADQKALEDLAAKCRDSAAELLQLLDDLKVKVKGKGLRHTWESLRQGCRTVWKKEKIAKFEKHLRDITVQVNGHLLSITRDETSAISQQVKDLIVTSKSLRLDLEAAINDAKTQLVAEVQAQSALIAISNHDQFFSNHYYALLGDLPSTIQRLVLEAWKINTTEQILRSLLFEGIRSREEQIHDAHTKTFTWIFDDDATTFKRWLISGHGTFWVSGKAGSGKSTLMKFLANHSKTKTLLHRWSGSEDLILASFYFWSAGHEAQKSQLGLMKSLLHQIIRQCPDLVPSLWSSRWNAGVFDFGFDTWSRQELCDAVDDIIARGTLKSKFCFFVDGLDEYADAHAGEQYALVEFLDHLTKSPHVKLCVSSRPWNVFKARYDSHDNLRLVLQDLTSDDMLNYAQNLLQDDERFLHLASREPKALSLAIQIRDKADGVFLWVYLVTRSLQRGLGEHDDLRELERRLARTPSDLIKFFRSIFKNIDDNYKDYTMRALQIAAIALPMPLGAFQYMPQEVEDQGYAFRQQVDFGGSQHDLLGSPQSTTADIETRVNKWCRDLLEVQHNKKRSQHVLYAVPVGHVQFLHRTVRDFLLAPEMQNLFLKHRVCKPSPWKAVCRMHLAYTKADCSIGNPNWSSDLISNTKELLYWAKLCEMYDRATPLDILNELAMTRSAVIDARGDFYPPLRKSMLQLAVEDNLLLYVDRIPGHDIRAASGILWTALLPRRVIANHIPTHAHASPHLDDLAMLAQLFEKGCCPDDGWAADDTETVSVWQKVISTKYSLPGNERRYLASPMSCIPTLASVANEKVAVYRGLDRHDPLGERNGANVVAFLLAHGADPDADSEVKFRPVYSRDFLMQVFDGDTAKVDALQKQARKVRSVAATKKPRSFAGFMEYFTRNPTASRGVLEQQQRESLLK